MRDNIKAWRAELKRAGIGDFRWHDLRHTLAGRHVRAGTPPHFLLKFDSWKSVETVKRYAHLSRDHLVEHGDHMSANRKAIDRREGVTDPLHAAEPLALATSQATG